MTLGPRKVPLAFAQTVSPTEKIVFGVMQSSSNAPMSSGRAWNIAGRGVTGSEAPKASRAAAPVLSMSAATERPAADLRSGAVWESDAS
jgi:hypothetical protein